MTSPEPNTNLAIGLLNGLDPAGRHDLFAIHPTLPEKAPGKTEAATFLSDQSTEMRAWIDERQGKFNIYTSVNRGLDDAPKNVRLHGENKKKNFPSTIGWVRAIVADIDPTKVKDGDASGRKSPQKRCRSRGAGV